MTHNREETFQRRGNTMGSVGRILAQTSISIPLKTFHKSKREGLGGFGKILLERNRVWIICSTLFLACTFLVLLKGVQQPTLVKVMQVLFMGHVTTHPPPKEWHNLLVPESSNYTSTLMDNIRMNGTSPSPCYGETTNFTILEGLPPPSPQGRYVLKTDLLHYLTVVAYDKDGMERCAGGDYFEVDLHDRENVHYRSRPATVDFGNGSYGLEIIVPSRFAGNFSLEIWLLFSNWHGMDYSTEPWVKQTLMVVQELELVAFELDYGLRQQHFRWSVLDVAADLKNPRHVPLKPLKQCTAADFDRTTWQGRWTRSWFNDACVADGEKRFKCLSKEHFSCEEPWCFGPVGRLESNGWEYSAHCSFKIFQREEAWKCLDGRWFLMWGDSNFQDTIRNMLLFILDWNLPPGQNLAEFQLARTYEAAFINPHEYDQLFRVSQLFNGANYEFDNGEGLNTLKHEEHQKLLLAHFNGTRWPDTVFMNSGLHDGEQFITIEGYVESADFAVEWWIKLYNSIPADRRPQLIWRTTIAPAGSSRKMQSNPNKMEMYNQVMVEKLQQAGEKLPVKFIDGFDLTFPFHYNNDFSDGGHYGRAPGVNLPPWLGNPHWYFVDVMLAHIFLNAACPST